MSKLSISEAAKIKGVSTSTLRRWELEQSFPLDYMGVEVTKIEKLLKN